MLKCNAEMLLFCKTAAMLLRCDCNAAAMQRCCRCNPTLLLQCDANLLLQCNAATPQGNAAMQLLQPNTML
jgi:hypothetical protein